MVLRVLMYKKKKSMKKLIFVETGKEVEMGKTLAFGMNSGKRYDCIYRQGYCRTALLAKGLREAGQTINNAFHTFADKPEVDYSQKEQKHPFTKAVLAPMKAVKKLLVSMELQLDASIDKLDNLAMNVQFDKEKRMEHTKDKDQKAPDTEREIIYSPMVAEPQEYKYNADAFEARKTSEAKQETAGKELPKVREDKAR